MNRLTILIALILVAGFSPSTWADNEKSTGGTNAAVAGTPPGLKKKGATPPGQYKSHRQPPPPSDLFITNSPAAKETAPKSRPKPTESPKGEATVKQPAASTTTPAPASIPAPVVPEVKTNAPSATPTVPASEDKPEKALRPKTTKEKAP
jgi:hypothetical protein